MTNTILDRWAKGESAGSIRKDLNLARNHVTQVVCEARKRRDPRAIHHTYPNGQIVGRYAHRPPHSGALP